ncbi:MAG: VTT domain-containing protein [Patescibacteria group bacterium]
MFGIEITEILQNGGLIVIALILFAETGLLVGFFLPGDTLLLAAGILVASGTFSFATLLPVIVISTILGNIVGYEIGHRAGPRLFQKEDSKIFRKEYLERAEQFYEKHGGKTILFARFIPIIRTFAPIVAGIGKMDKKLFNFYNILGGIVWGVGVTLIGYYFGSKIPNIDHYILPVILTVVLLSFLSPLAHKIIRR